jgi:putative FmdB family regulatory protein
MTYEYKCDKCGNVYTIERSIHEEEVAPICVGCRQSMSRVWSSPGVAFKGSGFYSTGG